MRYQIKIDGNEELFNRVEKVLLGSGYKWNSAFAKSGSKFGCIVIFDDKRLDWNLSEYFGKNSFNNLTQEQFFEIFGESEVSNHRGVVRVNGNKYLFQAIQHHFTNNKFVWDCSNGKQDKDLDTIEKSKQAAVDHYLYFNLETKKIGGLKDPKKIKVYSLEEVFDVFNFKPIRITLNHDYAAVVDKDGISVGCQKFSHETLDKLHAASLKARGEI